MPYKPSNKNTFINLSILILLFIISVVIRVDNLKKPMGRHHEYVTAHVLCTDYMFYKYGASKFYYSPVNNFDSEAERKSSKFYPLKDKENNFYYYSYPPFAFLFPHFIFSALNSPPSVLGIRIISLFIHLCSALLVFLLVLRFFNKSIKDQIFIPALISYFLYLFSTGNLWFHSQVYFSDMLVQPLILVLMLFLQKYFTINQRPGLLFYLGLFIVSFLAVYTEYLALFFLFFTGIYLIIAYFKTKLNTHLISIAVISSATILSLGLMLFQYSKIDSSEALKNAMTERYTIRSGHNQSAATGGLTMKKNISYDIVSEFYEENYSYLLDFAWVTFIIFILVLLFKKKEVIDAMKLSIIKLFSIALLAYLAHMVIFFNFNAIHDFGTLKFTLIIIPLAGFFLGVLYEFLLNDLPKLKKYSTILILCGATLFFHFSLNKYYLINNPSIIPKYISEIPKLTEKYATSKTFVGANVYFTYETCFYSKRRVEGVASLHDLRYILNHCNISEGLFLDRTKEFYNIIKINSKGDTLLYVKEPIK